MRHLHINRGVDHARLRRPKAASAADRLVLLRERTRAEGNGGAVLHDVGGCGNPEPLVPSDAQHHEDAQFVEL